MQSFLASLEELFDAPVARAAELAEALQKCIGKSYVYDTSMMLPSHVYAKPTGMETGRFLSIELGGTLLRVAIIMLHGPDKELEIVKKRVWTITEVRKAGNPAAFFGFIAECVSELLDAEKARKWRTGFAFSFPVQEASINSGRILPMGKGYTWAQEDTPCIKQCLDEAFANAGIEYELCAVANDSVATLLAQAYRKPSSTSLSLILGTGCNAAVFASPSFFKDKLKDRSKCDVEGLVAVNCELSMFGEALLPSTKYDLQIDEAASSPGYQLLEQRTSGRYLGELVRLIWLDRPRDMVPKIPPKGFKAQFGVTGDTVSRIEGDKSPDLVEARALLDELHPSSKPWSSEDAESLCRIARLISDRSVCLVAGSLVALGKAMGAMQGEAVTIACCGAVLELHANYLDRLQGYLTALSPGIDLKLVEHGGLVGAAVLAAMQTSS
jgi:hexokinase